MSVYYILYNIRGFCAQEYIDNTHFLENYANLLTKCDHACVITQYLYILFIQLIDS